MDAVFFTEQIIDLNNNEEMLMTYRHLIWHSTTVDSFIGYKVDSVPEALQIDKRESCPHSLVQKSEYTAVTGNDKGIKTVDPNAIDTNICTSMLDMMKDILDPQHMTAGMLESVTNPLDQSYVWPTSTTGTFVMIAAVCSPKNTKIKFMEYWTNAFSKNLR